MGTVWQIRGTNGSGKSTLARAFLPPNLQGDAHGGPVDLIWYDSPTKTHPKRVKAATGYGHGSVGVVGPYNTACGGLDALPSFAVQQAACRAFVMGFGGRISDVICEGILASTVYGSWAVFADHLKHLGHRFAFVYLNTPLEVCCERIRARQAAAGKEREIKWGLVADKHRAITATRERALKEGHAVFDLPFGLEEAALRDAMRGGGLRRVG